MVHAPPPPPPPPGEDTKLPTPLGVPKDYTVRRPLDQRFAGGLADTGNILGGGSGRTSAEMSVTPRYLQGAEFAPATLPPERIAKLQATLAQVGLIGPKTRFRLGVWDETSRNAYKNLLELANTYGMEESEALELLAVSHPADGSGQGREALPRTKLVNPDDLASIVDTVARATIGRKVDPAFVQRFVSSYHAAQQAEATAALGEGGTYVGAVDPRTLAEEMVRSYDPAGAAEMDTLGVANPFFDLLDGVGDPAPTKGKVKDAGGLDPVFDAKVRALIAASGGRVFVKSGYRSVQQQSALWNAALAKYGSAKAARQWVAPPGRSNHNRGVAVDLGGDLKLAAQLAPRFGLVRPMKHEPWHFEPLGLRSSKDAYTTGSVRAAERRMADEEAGIRTPVVPPSPSAPEPDRRAFTVEYQLANLGQILMGGDSGDQEQQG